MDIEKLIKQEMTPKTVTLWGKPYHDHTPALVDHIHGDGGCLMWIEPLATRPDYYIMRVDESVRQMIEDADDEIHDLVDIELLEYIDDEFGHYIEEDDDGNEIHELFPALDDSCGFSWGEIGGS